MVKYRRKVFEMNDAELQCVALNLALINSGTRDCARADLQERVVQWLLAEGLTIRHNFLFFEDEQSPTTPPSDGGVGGGENTVGVSGSTASHVTDARFRRRSIYLLKRMRDCDCCPHINVIDASRTKDHQQSSAAQSIVSPRAQFHAQTAQPQAISPSVQARRDASNIGSLAASKVANSSSSSETRAAFNSTQEPPKKYVPSLDEASHMTTSLSGRQYSKRPTNLNISSNRLPNHGTIIHTQPTAFDRQHKVYNNGSVKKGPRKKDDPMKLDCCCCKSIFVECGRFCVEILRG